MRKFDNNRINRLIDKGILEKIVDGYAQVLEIKKGKNTGSYLVYYHDNNAEIFTDFHDGDIEICSHCGQTVLSDNIIMTKDTQEIYCDDCANNYCYECSECNNYWAHRVHNNQRNLWSHNDGYICEPCLSDNGRSICQNCNELVYDVNGDGNCENCSTEHHEDDGGNYNQINLDENKILNNTTVEYSYPFTFGVEIETATRADYFSGTFKQTEDGSISGWEYVSPDFKRYAGDKLGMAGDYGLELIREFCTVLSNNNIKVDNDCGLHIHIGVGAVNFTFWRKILYVYKAIESELYKMLPERRSHNSFCVPIHEDYKTIESLRTELDFLRLYYDKPMETKKEIKNREKRIKYPEKTNRYRGLNLHSYMFRGTIELRYHSGTVNADKIINWLFINSAIIHYVLMNTFQDIKNHLTIGQPATNLLLILSRSILTKAQKDNLLVYIEERKEKFAQER